MKPSISEEEFTELGFKQTYITMDEEKGDEDVWHVKYVKFINPKSPWDCIQLTWSTCSNRYVIIRQTERLKNIFLFEGFLNSVEDFKFLYSLFDLSFFYEMKRDFGHELFVRN